MHQPGLQGTVFCFVLFCFVLFFLFFFIRTCLLWSGRFGAPDLLSCYLISQLRTHVSVAALYVLGSTRNQFMSSRQSVQLAVSLCDGPRPLS